MQNEGERLLRIATRELDRCLDEMEIRRVDEDQRRARGARLRRELRIDALMALAGYSDPARFFLVNCTVRQPSWLFDAVHAIWFSLGAHTQAPCFWDEARENYNTAGHIIDDEAERLAVLLGAIGAEAASRTASGDEETERLSLLIRHETLADCRLSTPLLADIAAAWGNPA